MSRVSRSLLLATAAIGIAFAATSASAASYSVIHDFAGAPSDGDKPQAKLVADAQGRLYGTTMQGGANFGGSVFRLTKTGKAWSEETLFSFPAGTGPNGTLLMGPSGELYGTAPTNGSLGQGTVWRLDPNGANWTLTTLHEFNPFGGQKDGFFPTAGLVFGKDGLLYGTTKGTPPQDGQSAKQDPMYGTVFSVSPMGDTTEYSVLHIFGGTNDGQFPGFGSLVADKKGVLTGTTSAGGANSEGMVFQITPPKLGTTWSESSIYDFKSTGLDAIGPFVGVVAGKGGVLFGCANGGLNGNGTVYSLTPAHNAQWSEQLLYNFGDQANDPKSNAVCDVSVNTKGIVFGTSSGGGVNNTGAIFRVDPPALGQTAWTETVLHSFGMQGSGDGTFPGTAPIQVGKIVYGVTPSGGANNRGAVYSLTP